MLGVDIIGNKTVKETEIRRHIKTRKDRNYDAQLVQEDLRRLFATRKFHNVRVHKKVEPRGVYVTFEVLERPMIGEVLFIGNRYYSDKKLLKEAGTVRRRSPEYLHGSRSAAEGRGILSFERVHEDRRVDRGRGQAGRQASRSAR